MAIQKPEWFKMDPAKFFSDAQVDAMSTLELGACFRLLGRQWIDGHIPDDQRVLARLCRLDDACMQEAWVTLSAFFPVIEPGKRANRFMWIEREKVTADLARRSDEGTRAAHKRWNEARKRDASPNAAPNGLPIQEPMQDQSRADQSRADSRDATGIPDPLAESEADSKASAFNSTEIAQILCQKNGWSGQQMIWTLKGAVEFQAKQMPESNLQEVGEWLVKTYFEQQRAQGKYAVGAQKFFAEGRYRSSSMPANTEDYFNSRIFTDNPATRALAQMEAAK